MSGSKRFALIIASGHFDDPALQGLVTPGQDAEGLARVLCDPEVANFEVKPLIDKPSDELRNEIEAFFSDRQRDDFLLIYFSTHGIKDDNGRLYLAAKDTNRRRLRNTTVPANFVNEVMTECRSRHQVLILDCCHSGAFARGMVAKGADDVGIRDQFQGRGRFVLTASNATQYAFQGDEVVGSGSRSVFTHHLIQGLDSGEADDDGDGWISLNELYNYLYPRVTADTPQQTPGKYAFDIEGEMRIARSRRGPQERSTDSMLREVIDLSQGWPSDEPYWFDYIGDPGDSLLATRHIAHLCLRDLWIPSENSPPGPGLVTLEGDRTAYRLPRGEFLFVGGGVAYPNPHQATFTDRVQTAFSAARSLSRQGGTGTRSPPPYFCYARHA